MEDIIFFSIENDVIYSVDFNNTSEIKIWGKDGKAINPPKGYKIRKDPAHSPEGQPHIHIYPKHGKKYSINKNGTQHDNQGEVDVPRKVREWLKKHAPDFPIPEDGRLKLARSVPLEFKVIAILNLENKEIYFTS